MVASRVHADPEVSHKVTGVTYSVPLTKTLRPAGAESNVTWCSNKNVAVIVAPAVAVTLCACAPPSDHVKNDERVPPEPWGEGAAIACVDPSAHQFETGAFVVTPSTVTSRFGGDVAVVMRYSVAKLAE